MKRPWMPLYIADYLAKTAHLNAAQSGAYLHLIMHYWQSGSLPDGDMALARIARMTSSEWKRERPVIQAFFVDGWRHIRIDEEIAHAADISSKRAASAKLKKSNCPAIAEQKDTHARGLSQSQAQSEPEREEKITGLRPRAIAAATRPSRFDEFWKTYPRRDGANPRVPARKKFESLVRSGTDPDEIIAAAGRYAGEIRGKGQERTSFVAQAMTWLNQQRWEDYSGLEVDVDLAKSRGLIRLMPETPQWEAWTKSRNGKSLPTDKNGGWWSPLEWPIGYEPNEGVAA